MIEVEILSEEPFTYEGLADIEHAIDNGECSGRVREKVANEEKDACTIARLLMDQGSDPGFFQLTENGADVEDTEAADRVCCDT